MPNKPEEKHITAPQASIDVFWGKGEALEPIFADNLHLQRINDQFYLTFGQVRLPLIETNPAERVVAEIRPVVRLIVPKDALQRVVNMLSRNLKPGEEEPAEEEREK